MLIDVNDFDIKNIRKAGKTIKKDASREETPVALNDNFIQKVVTALKAEYPDLPPLRFASIMKANSISKGKSKHTMHQHWHQDNKDQNQKNVIVYLTDVPNVDNGPIEIRKKGALLGPKGTATVYNATDEHRGLLNNSTEDRIALTMAFRDSNIPIRTIGSNYTILTNTEIFIIIVVALVLFWLLFMKQ